MCGRAGTRNFDVEHFVSHVKDMLGVPPRPEIMLETSLQGAWSFGGEFEFVMSVLVMLSTSVASPWMISSWVSRICWVMPGWSKRRVVSFEGVRARARALWPFRSVYARQAFAQPPVAPRKAMVISMVW